MDASRVTHLLGRVRDGDRGALDELMPFVYDELRRIARAFMRGQKPGHTLQPTALVNEAFIKVFHGVEPQLTDRAHLLALMARVMRQILIDHAREQGAAKRGGDVPHAPLDTNIQVAPDRREEVKLLDLDRALQALARENQLLATVLEMHYFGGMTAEEAALALGRSAHAVRHDLRAARAWLRRDLAR